MRVAGAALVAIMMTVSNGFAADGMLEPGKPAGTKKAQIETDDALLVAGVVLAAGAIALIASTTQSSNTSASTTSSTSSTGGATS